MPKVNDDYQPKWKYARIRSREAEYIEQVAEQYQERFIDALYRIVQFHRDTHLEANQSQQASKLFKSQPKPKQVDIEEVEIDTSLFD